MSNDSRTTNHINGEKVTLRSELRPGDIGWIVGNAPTIQSDTLRTGILDNAAVIKYELIVAKELANYFENFDQNVANFWLAEIDGVNVGFVQLIRLSESVAKLDKFVVEPIARGNGVGSRLIGAAIGFARDKGYEKVVLRTHPHMRDAVRIYVRNGFRLTFEEEFSGLGTKAILSNYELNLG